MNDIERLRKFLVRKHFFKNEFGYSGYIIEIGVFTH